MISSNYRTEIDGLRAIAVLAVIAFHFGYFPNGYLGVDVFFVISGYLITNILYTQCIDGNLSLRQFYIRRARRIMPLILFINLIALIIGLGVMLPDDLENLAQSVIATNFCSNNILQALTTKNYWDTANEFKPLMHTWSLGIEEQFYLLYPIVFLLIPAGKPRWLMFVLLFLTTASLLLLFSGYGAHQKFYLLPFRFFELSSGGLLAIYTARKKVSAAFQGVGVILLFAVLLGASGFPGYTKICLVVLATLLLLAPAPDKKTWSRLLLQNPVIAAIGKISFSLYMWHQLVLAFTRYFVLQEITIVQSIAIFLVIVVLSIATYFFVERPFRDSRKTNNKMVLWVAGIAMAISTTASLYVYKRAGVIRNVPELGLMKGEDGNRRHSQYNEQVYELDKDFQNNTKIKVLVIGNSFARDWVNILKETTYADKLDISYIPKLNTSTNHEGRLRQVQYIFFSELPKRHFVYFLKDHNIDTSKIWIVGTKSFGTNNGIFYNKKRDEQYYTQRTKPVPKIKVLNDSLRQDWGGRYIDLLAMVTDRNGTVPVFTPGHKFISHDCRHLTQSGAAYFAQLLESRRHLPLNNPYP